MSRRIDVELTSVRDDGSWTWRAAGAREPRGIVGRDVVPTGVKVGDVVRADADFDLDGVSLLSVAPITEKKRNEKERIEVLGRPPRDDQLVTSTLATRTRDQRGEGRDRGPRRQGDRRGGERPDGERGDRGRGRDGRRAPSGDRPGRGERGDRSGRAERGDRGRPFGDTAQKGSGGPDDQRTRSDQRAGRGADRARRGERRPPGARPDEPAKPKAKRLRPGRVHRAAVLDELPPEHRPIAEQVLAGDIPAVRQAIDKENEARRERKEATIDGGELLALAEKLRPRLRTAEWRDRADAAMAAVDELDLRDLRSVVVAADSAARDDETRALAAQLRDALGRRVEAEHSAWLADLTAALDEGRAVRALRLSSRPPKAGTMLDPALVSRLATAASASLTEDTPADRWAIVLEAIAFSPVRLTVAPVSTPKAPTEAVASAVQRFGDRVPRVAAAFGLAPSSERAGKPKPVPPPPPPVPAPPASEPAPVEATAEPADVDKPAADERPASAE